MSLISAGQGLRRTANLAQSKVASADVAGERMRLQSEMAEDAQKQSTIGTAGGIGGMVGANRAFANIDKLETARQNLDGAVKTFDAANKLHEAKATAETTAQLAEATAGVESAAVATGTAEAATGTLAQIGAVAAPVAIALGIGYLFSEIF